MSQRLSFSLRTRRRATCREPSWVAGLRRGDNVLLTGQFVLNFLKLFSAEYSTPTPGSVIYTHTEKSYFYSRPHLPLLPCPTEVIMFIILLSEAFSMQIQVNFNKYSLLSSFLLNCDCGRDNVGGSPNSPFSPLLRNSGRLSPSLLC